MPNKTTNYNLVKPLGTENYDIEVQNGNMDIIDAKLKENAEQFTNQQQQLNTLPIPKFEDWHNSTFGDTVFYQDATIVNATGSSLQKVKGFNVKVSGNYRFTISAENTYGGNNNLLLYQNGVKVADWIMSSQVGTGYKTFSNDIPVKFSSGDVLEFFTNSPPAGSYYRFKDFKVSGLMTIKYVY